MQVDQSQAKDGRSVPTGYRGRSLTVAALILAMLLVGCGVPGEPLPPLLEIPQPISDLSAVQEGARVRLTWSRPLLTTEGTRAQELDRMELYAVFVPAQDTLPSFPDQAQLLTTVNAEQASGGAPLVYEHLLVPAQRDQRAFFAIKAINKRGKDAGFSNIASLQIVNLPDRPMSLEAVLTEKAIVLNWQPAQRSVLGGAAPQPDGYRVYRAESSSAETALVIATSAVPRYEDISFTFGKTYLYFIRAFIKRDDSLALTEPSNTIELAALDRFPPAAPQNIRAVATAGLVEIVWSPNTESDLAGYNVYRSEGDPAEKANSGLLPIPLFRDTTVRAGVEYRYSVRAVDTSGNESVPSEETSIAAE
ncbi:MAG: hypothetical protein HY648_13855 [Acidobacteria bacterium]|nr:hypothetical protein [Acidobacteriota bacterium]